ncbi:antibiotic biosynthesis monooxygenase family protein (plasmid) [Sphingobium sp. SJ10-10]|uniref:antibiotic biosynthesis monooxygenase family protein n=1 Tax=Sphingobium sp. SJ10-10 TaxID=3114999 RepID=UPI002E180E54|nr:antibiotic biosynthesis monooxygenase family protein [Sphingobium sp. SJ10-10]
MLRQISQLELIAGRAAEFEEASKPAFALVRAGEGCRDVKLLRSIENPDIYYVLIEWDSLEHHRRFEAANASRVLAHIGELARHVLSQHFDLVDLGLES